MTAASSLHQLRVARHIKTQLLKKTLCSAMSPGRNIVIIGGVAGGMSCATRLRRLDEAAKITVIEKGPLVSPASCGIPYALGGVIASESQLKVQTADKIRSWFNVQVRVNTELIAVDRVAERVVLRDCSSGVESTEPYDKLVLAQGAEALLPDVEGINAPHVFTLQTITDLQNIQAYISLNKCQRAAVIGGGFIGLEAAENLRHLGLDVTVVEYLPHVFPPVDSDMAEMLHAELLRNGISLALNARIVKIQERIDDQPGKILLLDATPVLADVIVVATGVRSRTAIAEAAGLEVGPIGVRVNKHMQTSDPDIYAVGDMVEVPHLVAHKDLPLALAGPASRQGRLAADHICGRELDGFRGNVGTSICKVFGLTVGVVGLSNSAIDRLQAGIKYEYVTVHPPDHASYYPGAAQMTLRATFEVPSGKLLGAQIVGRSGVDKRIDVLAMAIRSCMSVTDLEHVELAYAPPYGAAKDAVNMSGFVGGNLLRGDVKVVHAADLNTGNVLLDKLQILDVRSNDEFSRGHLKNAVNIPIGDLRGRINELRKDLPTLVYCWVGYRGYLGYRILVQHGFEDVVNLDGGLKAVAEGGYGEFIVE